MQDESLAALFRIKGSETILKLSQATFDDLIPFLDDKNSE